MMAGAIPEMATKNVQDYIIVYTLSIFIYIICICLFVYIYIYIHIGLVAGAYQQTWLGFIQPLGFDDLDDLSRDCSEEGSWRMAL